MKLEKFVSSKIQNKKLSHVLGGQDDDAYKKMKVLEIEIEEKEFIPEDHSWMDDWNP